MRRSSVRVALAGLAVAILATAGCARARKTAGSAPHATPGATAAELQLRVARLELQLLERDAQIAELVRRLDEARREVVQAMAKLRTLATRAEAASGIAEAEIAVQSLRRRSGAGAAEELAQAARLLEMGTGEFDRQNYGGALYLAKQAKDIAGSRGTRTAADAGAPRVDEMPFAAPLRVRIVSRSNVRQGPGTGFPVVFTLDQGVTVAAHSIAGEWVRISDDGGRGGWVHLALVGRGP